MDLGATVCTRTRPACLLCPLEKGCEAHMLGLETRYPIPKPRKAIPQKRTLMPMLANGDGAILLYRRPSTGLWGGLWSLPELDDLDDLQHLADRSTRWNWASSRRCRAWSTPSAISSCPSNPGWFRSRRPAITWPRPTGSGITSPPRRAWALPPRSKPCSNARPPY